MDANQKYEVIISQMELEIKSQFGSVRRFCTVAGLDYSNMNKIVRGRQDISIGIYLKVCCTLKLIPFNMVTADQYSNTGTLRAYLSLPYQLINDTILDFVLK